ncbi:MAG: ABC transporter permease [Thermofilum sp.]|nr:ABC transporter permease [Thermofilum sp.]
MNFEALKALAAKEFKDLIRDPRIVVPFVLSAIVMPVIGLLIASTMQVAVRQAVETRAVAVADLDRSNASRQLARWLEGEGFSVALLETNGAGEAELAREAAGRGAQVLLVVEPGFEQALRSGAKPKLKLITLVKEVGAFGALGGAAVAGAVREFAASKLLEGSGISYDLVRDPAELQEMVYVIPKSALLPSPTLLAGLSMAVILIPIILASVALVVMQMSATAMAVENEERTLETLLTLPVSRFEMLLSKLLGMFAVSLIGTAFEMVGIFLYFYLLASIPAALAPQPERAALPIALSPSDAAFLAASLLLSLFFMAALGLIVGALSRDVRIANTVAGPLSMIVYLPSMLVAFAPSEALGPLGRALLYALPATQPVIAAKDAIGSSLPAAAPAYLALSLAATVALVYAASKLFSLELLSELQHKLSALARRGRGGGG